MISVVIISKDEPAIDATLTALRGLIADLTVPCEILVIDASDGRLDDIRCAHESEVRWVQFERPPGVRVTIPHQRNVGVRAAVGDLIVFTDAGCHPEPGWLVNLIAPLLAGEDVTAGLTLASTAGLDPYRHRAMPHLRPDGYLTECPTINMAFRRKVFDAIGGFDESFAYGSDADFSWRLVDAGFRILAVPQAIIRHDWGGRRRQLRRSYSYGKARAKLYRKHHSRLRHVLRDEPDTVIYPLFLLGLPLTLIFPIYPALLLIPAWRNRSAGVLTVLTDHLVHGAGVLAELAGR